MYRGVGAIGCRFGGLIAATPVVRVAEDSIHAGSTKSRIEVTTTEDCK